MTTLSPEDWSAICSALSIVEQQFRKEEQENPGFWLGLGAQEADRLAHLRIRIEAEL